MIFTAYGEYYSETTEMLSRLSGNRHCTCCSCKIPTDAEFAHTPRRDGTVMYLCSDCALMLNWKRQVVQPTTYSNEIRMFMDGLRTRQVL